MCIRDSGVGVSVVNALSEWLEVEVRSHGQIYRQSYERGRPVTHLEVIGSSDTTGTTITFLPDKKIFEITEFNFDTLAHRLRELAFLNKGIKICLTDERDDKSVEFLYEGGIVSFVEHLNRNKDPIHRESFYISKEINDSCVEVSLQYNDGYIDNTFSFANYINTTEGGTHLAGFRSALTRTINDYARKAGLLKENEENLTGDDLSLIHI